MLNIAPSATSISLHPVLLLEHWKPVVGYEGYYAISNTGRVERTKTVPGCRAGKILKPYITSDKYRQIVLSKNGKGKSLLVHALVAKTFIGPPPGEGYEVAHWDGYGGNNRVSNLRWATYRDNAHDRFRHNTVLRGESVGNAVLTKAIVIEGRKRYDAGETMKAIAESFGVHQMSLTEAIRGRRWKHITEYPPCTRARIY